MDNNFLKVPANCIFNLSLPCYRLQIYKIHDHQNVQIDRKYNYVVPGLLGKQITEQITSTQKKVLNLQIVRRDRTLERVVFPINDICSYLTKDTKDYVYNNTERDNQGSKVTEFFDEWETMYHEMIWQRKLQDRKWLSWCAFRLPLWTRLSFHFAFIVNALVARYYPLPEHSNCKFKTSEKK